MTEHMGVKMTLLSMLLLAGLAWSASLRAAPAPVFLYNSRAHGNDFDGGHSLADLGFTDVHGGVATCQDGLLQLTPDAEHDGTDAFRRDFLLRAGPAEQARDQGARVVLPPRYRTGDATVGLLLRAQRDGSGLLLNFAPQNNTPLLLYSCANGESTLRGTATLTTPYDESRPVALEARVVADVVVAFSATDETTGQILGFLSLPLNFGSFPTGSFGVVPWMISPGQGRIALTSIQTYPVTAVVCDGDSLTRGENATVGIGTASPLATTYPGQLQKKLGNRFHVFNLGRSGFTVTQMNADAASRVDTLLTPAERPPVVVIEGGTNDFGIDGSIKPPMTVTQAAQTVYARLQTYWAARHTARADAKVIDVFNTPAGHPVYARNLGSPSGFNQRRVALNTLRKLTQKGPRPDFTVNVTTDERIGKDGNEQNAAYFQANDHTHLTDAGYAAKAALIAPVVEQAADGSRH